ncbi:hypothetical protein CapIbe_020296 [Capra ibex]
MTNHTLCLLAFSCTRGTRQHGGNTEAGSRYSQDLVLLNIGGPERQDSRGCPALGLSVRRPAFHTEVHWHLGLGRR